MQDFTKKFVVAHAARFWTAAFLLGVSFDILFWHKEPGVNFPIFVSLLLGSGFLVLSLERSLPPRKSMLLMPGIAFFAVMSMVRLEPMTAFLSFVATAVLMAILAMTWRGGSWPRYMLPEYVVRFIYLTLGAYLGGYLTLASSWRQRQELGTEGSSLRRLLPVARGILIAGPIIALFAVLLASADAVFSQRLEDFFDVFNIDNIGEYFLRGLIVLTIAYFAAGLLVFTANHSQDEEPIVSEQLLPPFLGFTEAVIVLGSVIALFSGFVIIQFQYFFGGADNVVIDGFTYSEYARRGFGELVAVAIFSLLLLMALNGLSRRPEQRQRQIFSGMGAGVMLLVLVILVSAYQRMMLYEAAYGFSRLRTYTNVFIIWLGILLIAVVVLEIIQRQKSFALVLLMTSLGFVASLNVLNVDSFVARQNIDRVGEGYELDLNYLSGLSEDAVPAMVDAYRSPDLPSKEKEQLRQILDRFESEPRSESKDSWQSFHLSRWQADRKLAALNGKSD